MSLNHICTFIMPFRTDNPERQRNIPFAKNRLASLKAKIIPLEADVQLRADKSSFHENVEYIFVEDSNLVKVCSMNKKELSKYI